MKKIDARSLPEYALVVLRKQADRLRRHEHLSWKTIATLVGVCYRTMMKWAKVYKLGGPVPVETYDSKPRGRRRGEGRLLPIAEEAYTRMKIIQSQPSELLVPFAAWGRRAVQTLIQISAGLMLPLTTVGVYLRRWGMSPQRGTKRDLEQCPVKVKAWLQDEFPQLVTRAEQEKAAIYFGDETAAQQDSHWVRGYAPIGKTPIFEHLSHPPKVTMISAISKEGKVEYALYPGAINQHLFILFLEQMIANITGHKIYLIVDNLRVHKSKLVEAWVKQHQSQIELVYLPPYCPQMNPDEYLNCDIKRALRSQEPKRTKHDLWQATEAFMEKLRKTPQHVRSYFRHPRAQYAA
jgi:transposase